MDRIPDDIIDAAMSVAPSSDLNVKGGNRILLFIAKGMAVERERAAKAAEQRGRELGEPAIGSDIANTIRQPLAAPAPVGP